MIRKNKENKENKELCLSWPLGLIIFVVSIMTMYAFCVMTDCLMSHDVDCVCDFCLLIRYFTLRYDNINQFCVCWTLTAVLCCDVCFTYIVKYIKSVIKYFKKENKSED